MEEIECYKRVCGQKQYKFLVKRTGKGLKHALIDSQHEAIRYSIRRQGHETDCPRSERLRGRGAWQ